MRIIFLTILLAALSGAANAERSRDNDNGYTLEKYCIVGKGAWAESYCSRYIIGIIEAKSSDGRRPWAARVCTPKGTTKGQLVDSMKAWLARHPEQRHLSAESLVATALSEAWPCN